MDSDSGIQTWDLLTTSQEIEPLHHHGSLFSYTTVSYFDNNIKFENALHLIK
jgi:hypothetical protein